MKTCFCLGLASVILANSIRIGSFLAQLFLRAPMMEALTYEMKVEGPWKAPVVTKMAQRTAIKPVAPPVAK